LVVIGLRNPRLFLALIHPSKFSRDTSEQPPPKYQTPPLSYLRQTSWQNCPQLQELSNSYRNFGGRATWRGVGKASAHRMPPVVAYGICKEEIIFARKRPMLLIETEEEATIHRSKKIDGQLYKPTQIGYSEIINCTKYLQFKTPHRYLWLSLGISSTCFRNYSLGKHPSIASNETFEHYLN